MSYPNKDLIQFIPILNYNINFVNTTTKVHTTRNLKGYFVIKPDFKC